MTLHSVRVARIVAVGAIVAGCQTPTAVSIASSTSQRISAKVGQEVDIKLQTIGPGAYDSLPSVSSPIAKFVSMSYVGPFVPAGPTQLFKFMAVAPGDAIVDFRNPVQSRTVEDTISVR